MKELTGKEEKLGTSDLKELNSNQLLKKITQLKERWLIQSLKGY